MRDRNIANRVQGAWFEKVLAHRAVTQRFLCVRNGQECRFIGNGRVLPVKSNLDWTLVHPTGRVVFADSKSFMGSHFVRSQLPDSQMMRARAYQKHRVMAGFIVWLRELGEVTWFSASQIDRKGARTSFRPDDGTPLGGLVDFDLSLIFSQPAA